jgi:GNAT superfamily N-acetyltransferase
MISIRPAKPDDEIVGFTIWVPHREEPKTAHIKSVYLHPDWARRGIGTKLIKMAEQDALSSGYERFTVGASLTAQAKLASEGSPRELPNS